MAAETNSIPEKNPERIKILERIDEYERKGLWTMDVQDDPPTRPLQSGECDYLRKKLINKIKTRVTFKKVLQMIGQLSDAHQFILKGAVGDEKLAQFKKQGAIVTCNHFNAADSFALDIVFDKYLGRCSKNPLRMTPGRKFLWRVIREGNYTSNPGIYTPLFQNCNTLPLASSFAVMKEFMHALKTVLKRGEKVIVYAEQGMWVNYRKPRPLTPGAFRFAAENNVPVIPVFITMKDSEFFDGDGFPVQEYTVHVLEPIYADKSKSLKENVEEMKENNYQQWKKCYEDTYGIPLTYLK